jgi:hypothetical protein
MLIATTCLYWSPTGRTVWLSLLCGIAGIALTWKRKGQNQAMMTRWTVAFALSFLTLSVMWNLKGPSSFRELLGFAYKCYYAELHMATVVCVAFGIGFALAALRTNDWFLRIFGGFLLLPLGWFVFDLLEVIQRLVGDGS